MIREQSEEQIRVELEDSVETAEMLSQALLRLYACLDEHEPVEALCCWAEETSGVEKVVVWSDAPALAQTLRQLDIQQPPTEISAYIRTQLESLAPGEQAEIVLSQPDGAWVGRVMPLDIEPATALLWLNASDSATAAEISTSTMLKLRPHLEQVLRLIRKRGEMAEAQESLNVFRLALFRGGDAGMTPINDAAEALSDGDGWLMMEEQLQLAEPQGAEIIKRTISEICGGESPGVQAITLARRGDAPDLLVLICKIELTRYTAAPQCWMLIHDPKLPSQLELPEGIYRLSPAERAVARWVLRGLTAPETAAMLKVSPWTVRTHLKNIFLKTGTNRQAELVALLIPLLSFIYPDRDS